MRKFYNYTATIYTLGTSTVKGSLVETRTVKYTNIPIALWKNTKSYGETTLGTQTDSNQYEINLYPQCPVSIGDIVVTKLGEYKVDQVIEHHTHKGKLDNFQVYISKTT